jgi:hypothetical protein
MLKPRNKRSPKGYDWGNDPPNHANHQLVSALRKEPLIARAC